MKSQVITLGVGVGGIGRDAQSSCSQSFLFFLPLLLLPPPSLSIVFLLQVRGGGSAGKDHSYRVEAWDL